MAEKEFEAEDPFTLTGMVLDLPAEAAVAAQKEMAACFIEEYMLLGYDDERILSLFRDPFYKATHAVLHARGEAFVRALIREVRGEV